MRGDLLTYFVKVGSEYRHLPVRSWARMRVVLCGRVCSEGLISGAGSDRMEFGSYDFRHSSTIVVCIVLRFWDMASGVAGMVFLLVMLIVFLPQSSNMVCFFFLGHSDCLVRSCRGCVGN